MVNLDFSIVGANGDTVLLDGSQGIHLTVGLTGVGIPSTDVRIDPSAGDGGTWRSTRRNVRELDLPIVVVGADRGDVEDKLRRVARALNDRYGTPKLVATYSDGDEYQTEVHYVGGAETQFGSDAGETFCRWMLTVQAPDPFWTSTQAVQFTLGYQSGVRGLLPALEQLQVSPSQVIGSFNVENPGDVDAFPVWTLEGVSSSVSISREGQGFTFTESTAAGDVRVIDTRNATVVDESGANKYAFLGSAPKLFALPPGRSAISVNVAGAELGTKLSGFFLPRREVLF